MQAVVAEAVHVSTNTALHVLGLLALEPAGMEAVITHWESVFNLLERSINSGRATETASALRLMTNLYNSEPGIAHCLEQFPVFNGLALKAVERKEMGISEYAGALWFNMLVTNPEVLDREELMPVVQFLVFTLQSSESKALEVLYAAKALALIATASEEFRRGIREMKVTVPLRSELHLAIYRDLKVILGEC